MALASQVLSLGALPSDGGGETSASRQADSAALAEVSRVISTVAVAWRDLVDRVDTVANDDLLGSALATRHLIELGHRRIAHIAGHVPGSPNAVGGATPSRLGPR